MKIVINIKSKKAVKEIQRFRDSEYLSTDIKFTNLHLKRLNELVRKKIFAKNDSYINAKTLFELMQDIGNRGSHNYHGLKPSDIIEALVNLEDPMFIYKDRGHRYVVAPTFISSFSEPLVVIIETGASLIGNKTANVNKIITIYPKTNLQLELLNLQRFVQLYIKNKK